MLPFRSIIAKGTVPIFGTPAQLNSHTPKQDRHRHCHTDVEWEDQKQTVFRLYIKEDRAAEAAIETLREDFAFEVRYMPSDYHIYLQRLLIDQTAVESFLRSLMSVSLR
jgi:hypothetical protein